MGSIVLCPLDYAANESLNEEGWRDVSINEDDGYEDRKLN